MGQWGLLRKVGRKILEVSLQMVSRVRERTSGQPLARRMKSLHNSGKAHRHHPLGYPLSLLWRPANRPHSGLSPTPAGRKTSFSLCSNKARWLRPNEYNPLSFPLQGLDVLIQVVNPLPYLWSPGAGPSASAVCHGTEEVSPDRHVFGSVSFCLCNAVVKHLVDIS